jgi:hypothetical protein
MQRFVHLSGRFDGINEGSFTRNWKLYGLEADLNISDKQYLIALTVFFFPYATFEVCSISTRLENIALS